LTPSLYGGRRKLCGGLSEFDRQLFFKTALIALERAPIAALPHWLDAPHHHSGSAILAPGAPFDDLQRTRNKLGLGHRAPPVPGGSFTGLSATDAWHRAEPVMQHIQHLSFESLVKMDHFSKRAIAKEGCLMRCHHDGISSACGYTAHRVSLKHGLRSLRATAIRHSYRLRPI
jgi:hypothetical protein